MENLGFCVQKFVGPMWNSFIPVHNQTICHYQNNDILSSRCQDALSNGSIIFQIWSQEGGQISISNYWFSTKIMFFKNKIRTRLWMGVLINASGRPPWVTYILSVSTKSDNVSWPKYWKYRFFGHYWTDRSSQSVINQPLPIIDQVQIL